jgi:4-hydroxybenzoate polyprenyltransferase
MNAPAAARTQLGFFLAASRFHIVLIAGLGTVTYGWFFAGVHDPWPALLSALDWWVLDIGNKLSDLREDLVTSPDDARWVERHRRRLAAGCAIAFAASLVPTALYDPWLLPARLLFQLLGIAYNFPVLPGLRRFKALYFWKNTMAGVLFLLSIVLYPLIALRAQVTVTAAYVVFMALFFFFLEHSFEILYDFKDIAGDRQEGVRTYPAVHGERVGVRAFYGAVTLSTAMILLGLWQGSLGFQESLILLAPAVQLVAFQFYRRRGYRAHDSVTITHLGSLQLLMYNAYLWSGLPIPPW